MDVAASNIELFAASDVMEASYPNIKVSTVLCRSNAVCFIITKKCRFG